MDMARFFITKEEDMLDNGNKTRWKEKEFFITLITQQPIRVIGKTINFMVLALYSTNRSKNFMDLLTIEIGRMQKIIG